MNKKEYIKALETSLQTDIKNKDLIQKTFLQERGCITCESNDCLNHLNENMNYEQFEYVKKNILKEYLKASIGFSIIILLIKLISMAGAVFMYTWRKKLNIKYTNMMRQLAQNDEIEVYEIPNTEPNAFNMGSPRLYYTSSLSKLLTENEMIAILCHEYGHYAHHDNPTKSEYVKKYSICFLADAITFYAVFALPQFGLIAIVLRIIYGGYTSESIADLQKKEYAADSHAATMGYKKEMISGLKKTENWVRTQVCKDIGANNSKECDAYMIKLHQDDEHPETADRIKALAKQQEKEMKKADTISKKGKVIFKTLLKLKNLMKELKGAK